MTLDRLDRLAKVRNRGKRRRIARELARAIVFCSARLRLDNARNRCVLERGHLTGERPRPHRTAQGVEFGPGAARHSVEGLGVTGGGAAEL